MTFLDAVHPVSTDDLPRIVDVWEASVRAEHDVVSEAYIEFFKPIVRDELVRLVELAAVRADDGAIVGFVAIADSRIEALFVHPGWRRMGIGRRLTQYAVTSRAATSVDLDEQNVAGIAFFRSVGFAIVGRSDIAGVGKAFPRVHLQYRPAP
jgi:putative acetyltransferase